MGQNKSALLSTEVRHFDITQFDFTHLVDAMQGTAFQARNLARAAQIYEQMLRDNQCSIILCLAICSGRRFFCRLVFKIPVKQIQSAFITSYQT